MNDYSDNTQTKSDLSEMGTDIRKTYETLCHEYRVAIQPASGISPHYIRAHYGISAMFHMAEARNRAARAEFWHQSHIGQTYRQLWARRKKNRTADARADIQFRMYEFYTTDFCKVNGRAQ